MVANVVVFPMRTLCDLPSRWRATDPSALLSTLRSLFITLFSAATSTGIDSDFPHLACLLSQLLKNLRSRHLFAIATMSFHEHSASETLPCMRRIRSALTDADEDGLVPLQIDCNFGKNSSAKCDQCRGRKDTGCGAVCFIARFCGVSLTIWQVIGGMVGDLYDMMIVVNGVQGIVLLPADPEGEEEGEEEDNFWLSEDCRRQRAEFGLAGQKKKTAVSSISWVIRSFFADNCRL